jgi:molybdopterin/thiamine biosynthesis adenylyltransferase
MHGPRVGSPSKLAASRDMANTLPLGIDRAGAISKIDRWLVGTLGARRLEDLRDGSSDCWRIAASISGRDLELDVELPHGFPRDLPCIYLAAPPDFATWPHVERSGKLCITSPVDRYDRTQPAEVVQALLLSAFDIIEQGITGTNEDDFRTEFLSYWNADVAGMGFQSIIDPSGPSRTIEIWRGQKLHLIADTKTDIRRWLGNRGKANVADASIKDAALLWFERPILPREYPKTVDDLYELAGQADGNATGLLDRMLKAAIGPMFTLVFGAATVGGVCFGGIELELRRIDRGPKRKGRRGSSPSPEIRLRQWKSATLRRTTVDRADAFWIHGRDANADLLDLRCAKVALVGCGSLGSPVAHLLAQAGVGELRLIDPDFIEFVNVGRHVLGASAHGQNKALALAAQLRRDLPHSEFVGHAVPWQECAQALEGCDLIISTTGSLDDEAELTTWQRTRPGKPFVFGWTEPRACASHAVAILRGAGCLLCGFDLAGDPEFQATKWPATPLRREAACGNWFMPYGADEIMLGAILVTDLALDVLMDRAVPGIHRVESVRAQLLGAAGGEWTDNWLSAVGAGSPGARTLERSWLPNIHCPACLGLGPA